MTIAELREKRVVAGISGRLLCAKAGVDRGRLSAMERGYIQPFAGELARLEQALSALLEARRKVAAVAAEGGWPVAAV